MKKADLNILIVEDENIIALDIKASLLKMGYKVTSIASSGEEALIKLERDEPDLVILDIMLKGSFSGIEVAEEINKKYQIPFIFLTALTNDETLEKAKLTEPHGYIVKPFDDTGLRTSIEMAVYKHQVEKNLKIKTRELEEEKRKNEKLLKNILPAEIITELKSSGNIIPKFYKNTTILFTDFFGLSNFNSDYSPDILLEELNDIFKNFDGITEKHKLEKIKTIGDVYMCAAGLPVKCDDHAVRTIKAAIEMYTFIESKNKSANNKWKFRAGINSGPVVAGIVGSNKYCYDVWGDTVNIASRIQNSATPGNINISSNTFQLVKNYFSCASCGKLNSKGMEEIEMFTVSAVNQSLIQI